MKDDSVQSYPLFRKENIKAYVSVMIAWAIVSVVSAVTLVAVSDSSLFWVVLVWAAVTTMLGMAIMIVTSLTDLRKLAPDFWRLAQGEHEPRIPAVLCPVLTAATDAVVD